MQFTDEETAKSNALVDQEKKGQSNCVNLIIKQIFVDEEALKEKALVDQKAKEGK
jgi:hypothetical protein